MQTLTLKAPAKINLYLRVLNKRPDGFHNIETIFEKIDLCDEVSLKKRKQGIKVLCAHPEVPENKSNLGYRAAETLLARANYGDGVLIRISKRIPVACGLGGGSSNAASVLLGLNKLLLLGLTRSQLREIAQEIGADVPFFILPNLRAVGRGKGEILTPIAQKRKNWYILVIPRLAVSTRSMYRHPRLTLTKASGGVKIVLRALEKGDLSSLDKYSYNSFERILTKKYSQVLKIKKALKSSGAPTALISGSGPCVFAITQTRKEAMDIKNRVQAKNKDWQIIVARTLKQQNKSIAS